MSKHGSLRTATSRDIISQKSGPVLWKRPSMFGGKKRGFREVEKQNCTFDVATLKGVADTRTQ